MPRCSLEDNINIDFKILIIMVLSPLIQDGVQYEGPNLQIIQRSLEFLEVLSDFRSQQGFSFM